VKRTLSHLHEAQHVLLEVSQSLQQFSGLRSFEPAPFSLPLTFIGRMFDAVYGSRWVSLWCKPTDLPLSRWAQGGFPAGIRELPLSSKEMGVYSSYTPMTGVFWMQQNLYLRKVTSVQHVRSAFMGLLIPDLVSG